MRVGSRSGSLYFKATQPPALNAMALASGIRPPAEIMLNLFYNRGIRSPRISSESAS
jgi:hypothetical protein